MARSLDATSPLNARAQQLRLGIWIETLSFMWMLVEASIAITAGLLARSISLEGFGFDSIIELVAGGVLLWRLTIEQRGAALAAVQRAERRAAWITALSLFVLALYIVVDSGFSLLARSHPQVSWVGIGLAI